jgi:hypothetical protein
MPDLAALILASRGISGLSDLSGRSAGSRPAQNAAQDFRPDTGAPLPSIRALARHFGAAPLTVHRALRRLQAAGHVHALPRKGFYWGMRPAAVPGLPPRLDKLAAARNRLVTDLRCGVFHPHRDLPPRAALAPIYGLGVESLGRLLAGIADQGLLIRRGRGFALPPPPRTIDQGTVLVVMRCDASGMLLLDTERQTDFVKSVHREGRERGLRIVILGWRQGEGSERMKGRAGGHATGKGGGVFLDQNGKAVDPRSIPGLLMGCLASTWLVKDPAGMLLRLRRLGAPVSVWWEHSPEAFPRFDGPGPQVLGFDISFGKSSGIAMGRHLRSRGEGPVAFISPFHGGTWSRSRFEGIREALDGSGLALGAFVDRANGSAWDYHQAGGNVARGEKRIRAVVRSLLRGLDPARYPVWVSVNDHTAVIILELLRGQGKPRPRLLSFDNSTASDAHQFDSFEFHTEGMVRQMLYHLLHPGAPLFKGGGLHEMVGRLVLRT